MKIKDVALLAGVVGAGVLLFSKWGEITKGFGSWGIGPDAPIRPPDTPFWVPPSVTPYIRPDLPPGYRGPALPDIMPIPPPSIAELIFPPIALLPDVSQEVPFMPTPPPPPTFIETLFPPAALVRFIAPPTPPPPTYTPSQPATYEPSAMVPDPRRPPGSVGGR